MDINSIALIIITAFINSAVFLFMFYRRQKEIDAKFDKYFYGFQKQLDEIYAKSMLEYQTKFVRNHEKMVDTIEILYQMYSDFRLGMTAILHKVNAILSDTPILTDTVDDIPFNDDEVDGYVEKTHKFREYYFNNRLYLPSDEIKNTVQNVVHFQGDIIIIIKYISIIHINASKLPFIVEKINFLIDSINKTTNIHFDFIEPNLDSVLRFIVVIIENLNNQYLILEKIHDSVSSVA